MHKLGGVGAGVNINVNGYGVGPKTYMGTQVFPRAIPFVHGSGVFSRARCRILIRVCEFLVKENRLFKGMELENQSKNNEV